VAVPGENSVPGKRSTPFRRSCETAEDQER
jgi:hypothetical protein